MKLNILFLLYKAKTNSKGKCPIKCRITFNKTRKEFSTGLFIKPEHWNSKTQFVEPPEPDEESLNTQLSLIKTKLSQAFLFLQVRGTDFDVDDVLNKYKGETPKTDYGVLEIYNLHTARIKKLVGLEIQEVTYSKYVESGRHLKCFIKFKYKVNDIKLKTLKSTFLEHYEYYLKTEKNLKQSTLNKVIQRFRSAIKYAISEDYLDKDPFMLYKAKRVKKEVVFLSSEQLKILEDKTFKIERIQKVKDMFVFCCYTGLGFTEMKHLKKKDISKEFDGELWINVKRSKTKRSYKVPLLPKAQEIMNRYKADDEAYVFANISNANFNAYLKEIADLCNIDINLTHHIARKTFASTVLLYNNVPIEVVSKLLGHAKIQTTQDSYGKVVEKQISMAIKKLKKQVL
ncbi:site-specific integrase [Lacinutrix sp.]|uniref:site-specific integrase n=1 Tax=Lacinutrix sp. TaxID=1937692 RepID=UPI00263963CA|nr:site-specific integrase [Lacinutrix sp.]MDG1715905.1 site-specific integrase [Lacinutrix sp.]